MSSLPQSALALIRGLSNHPSDLELQYKLSQEQDLLRQTIGELAQSEIVPLASKIDWDEKVPASLLEKLPSSGLYGITIPQEYGGAGADFLGLVLVIEELSKASGSLAAQISLHNSVVAEAITLSKNSDLKSDLLPKLASGTLGAFSLDPKSTITCKPENDGVEINGTAEYVMSATSAGIFLIQAKMSDGSMALICFPRDDKISGFKIGAEKKLLGLRASQTASVSFGNVKLPRQSLLFDIQQTESALVQLRVRSRLAVAAQALGLGQASLDAAVKYSNERKQFNMKIGSFYAVKDVIAQDEIALQSARTITYSVASVLLSSTSLQRDSAIAKVSASNSAVQAARHSIRVHGGYGFVRDYPVERFLRDARATQIYLESNEALKDEIATSLID